MRLFFSIFVKKRNVGRILFIFIHSLILSSNQKLISGEVCNLLFSVVKREFNSRHYNILHFFLLSKFAVMWRPRNQTSVTALFKNTQILKFKSRLTFAFFAAVNHLSGPLLWFVICDWRISIRFVRFSVSRFVAFA